MSPRDPGGLTRPRSCLEFPRGVAASGTAASGVVVSRDGSAITLSSALDSTAPDAAPSPALELQTGPRDGAVR